MFQSLTNMLNSSGFVLKQTKYFYKIPHRGTCHLWFILQSWRIDPV